MTARKPKATPTPATPARPIYAYVRCSTEEQELGPVAQEARIRQRYPDIAADHIFVEHASAKDLKGRPIFRRLLTRVCHEQALLVVVKSDRLSRSLADTIAVAEKIEQSGGVLHVLEFGHEPQPPGNPLGELMRNMHGSFGQYERQIISERTKAALAVLKDRGVKLGGARRPGYRQDGTRILDADGNPTEPRTPGPKPGRAAANPARACINRMLDHDPSTPTAMIVVACGCAPGFVARVKGERRAAANAS